MGELLKNMKLYMTKHRLGTGQRYEMVRKEVRMEHDKTLSDYLDPRGNNRVVLLRVSDDGEPECKKRSEVRSRTPPRRLSERCLPSRRLSERCLFNI